MKVRRPLWLDAPRFGIRFLPPTMRKVAEKLEDLRTAEGTLLPQNTLSELRRHLARLHFVRDQIRAVEQEPYASSR